MKTFRPVVWTCERVYETALEVLVPIGTAELLPGARETVPQLGG